MSKSRNAITPEQCRAMGYCPSCGNPISEGVDCCGNAKQSNFDALPRLDSPHTRIDTGGERQNAPASTQTAKKRDTHKTTKAEESAMAFLKAKGLGHDWQFHPMTLRFPDGDRYTPDIVGFPQHPGGDLLVIEVKGGYRGPGWEQGMERYKRAKEMWGKGSIKFGMIKVSKTKIEQVDR